MRDDLLSSPDNAAYRAATTPHNATVVQRPAMVAQARSADDVADAVRWAAQHTLYAASKAAVSAMVLNLAPELAERGIAINAIAPGGTATDMAAKHASSYTPPSLRGAVAPENILKAVYALGRRAEPSEIASIAAFLLSEDASYITGATIDASGGRM